MWRCTCGRAMAALCDPAPASCLRLRPRGVLIAAVVALAASTTAARNAPGCSHSTNGNGNGNVPGGAGHAGADAHGGAVQWPWQARPHPPAARRAAAGKLGGSKPNIVVIYGDDLGYGDLEAFGGHPTSDTPALDSLVRGGMRFNSMYTSSPVCSPSRSSVMSGRYMTRNGVWPGVFSPNSAGGLALTEKTLPQLLAAGAGYDTFMAGKWHLGVGPDGVYHPFHRGFQNYHGVPYGVDMCSLSNINMKCFAPDVGCNVAPFVGGGQNFPGRDADVPCPYYENFTITEQPTSLLTIDEKYVNATRAFILAHAVAPPAAAAEKAGPAGDKQPGQQPRPNEQGGAFAAAVEAPPRPFFVYFCSHHTHVPVFANAQFTNTSGRGWFGDHLRMLDWTVGEIVQAVHDAGVAGSTLILFSADNGPSLTWMNMGGNNGALRCGKGTTWEGGQRVPGIAFWPGVVAPGVTSHAIVSTMDFFATSLSLAGVAAPADRTIDAVDFTPVLQGHNGTRDVFVYWGSSPSPAVGLHAVRKGDWKLHWYREGSHCSPRYFDPWCYQPLTKLPEPLLYNLAVDVGEVYNLTLSAYADVVAELTAIKQFYEGQLDMFGPSEVKKGGNDSLQPCANPACKPGTPLFPICCQTNYTYPPQPPPSSECAWQPATSLGLPNATRLTAAMATKEACCGWCRSCNATHPCEGPGVAKGHAMGRSGMVCGSAHFDGSLCHLWSGFNPRPGTGIACIPNPAPRPPALGNVSVGGGGGGADLPWRQSYTAGYKDAGGHFCGGSEIMHIKSHKGRLYAFSGYWQDAHYPGTQSAQVLRLDSPNGQWQCDLDTGAGSSPTHMKGNIMHSVTFATDANGAPINETLLIAASQQDSSPKTNGTALSVYQRDDSTGAWSLQTLLPGPKWQGRKVPRDMQVYHDDVTGVDRIFLLAGQPGILSGVFDRATGKVQWEPRPEFPTNGSSFAARPLGLQIANGRLYFAVGGYIFVRTNGKKPSWDLAYTIPGKVNIEVGGIRGLTTIANPTGPGDSLIFVWVPQGKAKGQIIRLDGPELVGHSEVTLQHLYDQLANSSTPSGGRQAAMGYSTGTLGGYNNLFAFPHPGTGATLHIVGFETTVKNASGSLMWHNFYAGGCYGIRSSATKYDVFEVNGQYARGKPVLEAARAFALSPFEGEEHVLYVGGFDTNFHNATNMAWIFKAGAGTVIGSGGRASL